MDFETKAPSWDPLGDPVPVAEMGGLLGDAERAAPPPGSVTPSGKSGFFLLPAVAIFVFGGFAKDFLLTTFPVPELTAPWFLLSASPWILATVLFVVGVGYAKGESRIRDAAVRLEKLRYARRSGWTLAFKNRYKRFQQAFPAFMRCGSSPAITEEWWGNWRTDGRDFQVWVGELEYQVPSGKRTVTEYSPIIGVRVRSPSPAPVTLTPEDWGTKFAHLFKGEYKTGNAEFDAAFNIVADAALQSSSALPSVLNPPFLAAAMRCRAGRSMWLVRDRDMLLVRFIGMQVMMPPPDSSAARVAGGVALLEDAALGVALQALVEPVVALAEEAGL